MRKKAQTAVEYVVVIAFLLAVVGILFLYANTTIQRTVGQKMAENAVNSLAKAADQICASSPGTTFVVEIDLPEGIVDQNISGHQINLRLEASQENFVDVFASTKGYVIGELPTSSGKKVIEISMMESGVIRIGGGIEASPSIYRATLEPGDSNASDFILWNNTSTNLTGITANIGPNISDFVTVNGLASGLDANQTDAFQIQITVPADYNAGFYSDTVDLHSTQGYAEYVTIQVNVVQVLTGMQITIYSDEYYLVYDFNFFPNHNVYYLVEVADQTGQPAEVDDLNIVIKRPDDSISQSLQNQSTPNGRYEGIFIIDDDVNLGDWNISAESNYYSFMADWNWFTLSPATQSVSFEHSWIGAGISSNGKIVQNWTISNLGDDDIVIDEMKVQKWSENDADNAQLSKIKLNNDTVWDDSKGDDDSWIDITDFTVEGKTTYSSNNKIEFDKRIDDDSEDFNVSFHFTDGTVYETTTFEP